jgi:hypothetical protein
MDNTGFENEKTHNGSQKVPERELPKKTRPRKPIKKFHP